MATKLLRSFSEIPGPKGLPFIGSLLDYTLFGKYSFDRIYEAFDQRSKLYGTIYKEKLGPITFVHVSDPKEIMKILQNEPEYPNRLRPPILEALCKFDDYPAGFLGNGHEWWNYRQPVQKILTSPSAGSAYLSAQISVADDLVKYIDQISDENGFVPNTLNTLMKYTMESIGVVAFDSRIGIFENGEIRADAEKLLTLLMRFFEMFNKSMYMFPLYLYFRTPFYKEISEVSKNLIDIITKLIKEREKIESTIIQDTLTNADWTEKDKVFLANSLFSAGADSTGNALCFFLYNLAKNPDKQEKLADEINQTIGNGEDITMENLEQLSYLKACLRESFRINHPVIAGPSRVVQKRLVISNYEIPVGTVVWMNCEIICKSSEHFTDPKKFEPERWLVKEDGKRTGIPVGCLLPFGYGRRMCIGRRFAEQVIYLAAIKLLKTYSIKESGQHLGMIKRTFTAPDRIVNFQFIKRSR